MAYTKQTWVDLPSKTTPINAIRLNYMEDGIESANTTATTSSAGQMSASDKTKLNGISSNAKNVSISVSGEAMTITVS